jgi:hypothetical protein
MSSAWLVSDTEKIAISDQNKVHICDDCPCGECNNYATTYAVVRIAAGPIPAATATITLGPDCLCAPCSTDLNCHWLGEFHQSPDFGYEHRTGQLWFRHSDLRWVVSVYNGPYPVCGSFFSDFTQDVPDLNTIPGNYGGALVTVT